MSQSSQDLSFTQTVKASPAQVYHAFTNATALREWLCDYASTLPRVGGRLYLWWNSGYYTAGEFTALEPERKAVFSWLGRGDPGATQVSVTIQADGDGTQVHLEHTGLGRGEEWQAPQAEIKKGWVTGLENLASVLETGQDLRFVRRPMLGVLLNDFDAEIAAAMGLPISGGIRLSGVVEGMGAQAAGLQDNDVIVGMAGKPVQEYSDIANILAGCRAGDTIEVEFFRDGKKQANQMTLSGRSIQPIPESGTALADLVKEQQQQAYEELERLLEGITDTEAEHRPEQDQWNIKENLGHLILSERNYSSYIYDLVGGQERVSDDYPPNSLLQIQALVSAYPTLKELLAAYRTAGTETVAYLASLPEDFIARKGSFWRLAYGFQPPDYHLQEHFEMIRAALASARGLSTL